MVLLRQKVYVSGGDDADKFAAHLASLCDRDPREAVADLCLKDITDRVPGAHHHWVCYETLLKFLARTITRMFSKALSIYGLKSILIYIDYMWFIFFDLVRLTLTLRTSLAWNSAVQL